MWMFDLANKQEFWRIHLSPAVLSVIYKDRTECFYNNHLTGLKWIYQLNVFTSLLYGSNSGKPYYSGPYYDPPCVTIDFASPIEVLKVQLLTVKKNL